MYRSVLVVVFFFPLPVPLLVVVDEGDDTADLGDSRDGRVVVVGVVPPSIGRGDPMGDAAGACRFSCCTALIARFTSTASLRICGGGTGANGGVVVVVVVAKYRFSSVSGVPRCWCGGGGACGCG